MSTVSVSFSAAVVLRAPLSASDHGVQPELLHDARTLLQLLGRRRIQEGREGRTPGGRGRWIACFMISHWQKSQVGRFSGCCTADLQADKYRNQMNNNLKIDEVETFASDC